MKKPLLILLAAGMFASCGTGPETTLDGAVTGIADGTKVYLSDGTQVRIDSTAVAGGKFRFEIAKAYPDRYSLSLEGRREAFPFIVEPGAVTATLNAETSPATTVFAGTPTNDAIKTFNDGFASFNERSRRLIPMLDALVSQGKGEGTPEFDDLYGDYEKIQGDRDRYIAGTVRENAGTVLAAYIANSTAYGLSTPAMVDSVLALVGAAPPNAFTDRLRERREVLAKTAIGSTAPDFTQNRPDGTPFTLSSLRGKLVLIDFWASWCGPCRAENPNVVKVYDKYHDLGFEIVGVSLDSSREEWLKGIEEDGLRWIHVSDLGFWNNAVAVQYAVRSIPHTVLVGADGVIIAKNLRGPALEARIAEVLGAK